MPSCIKRLDLGGRDVIDELLKRLMERGALSSMNNNDNKNMNHYYQCHDQVKKIKEKECSIMKETPRMRSHQCDDMMSSSTFNRFKSSSSFKQYVLPEGGVLQLCERDLQECGEIMFRPERFLQIGTSADNLTGLRDLIVEAVNDAAVDCRKDLFGNLVLSGGNTLMPNMTDRVSMEVIERVPATIRIKVVAPPERLHSAWIGGSILTSLSTFQPQWITRGEYHEVGPSVVFRKTLV
ncbi:hypothetical protein FDP41_008533 [Naegleria fowleri]|uniref:Actin n=1 Tax=Naegleria fowleri TaxID=5763 RepID=A0A6A5BFD0_NAEFO|nr:uncharacterized protein FDP41_008533 [Naegleria fowleri]KAF0973326.1 hypothetical protein FDP41_008533 [Naegleria fowleri]